ncbi:MAG: YdiU family protein [Pyrinomonadaceae bacterium]|nr:YdiU family protein [Pyrinomonadaceae bacterium]
MYERFEEINGLHPWREVSRDAYVDYRVRYRPHGRVLYFNFPLAREMELVPADHPAKMNEELERIILETFSLQIINEYDLNQRRKLSVHNIKLYPFMATRYLQLQHKSKRGETSGDGRSIWNGCVKTPKMIFDVSSRGTGATILSPGAQVAEDFIPTGDYTHGYASGLANPHEMLGSAVMSEILYRQGIPTERTLAVIDFRDETAIGVRTAPNLIRPAHIFRYLKQGRHAELKASFDYFIGRQVENNVWKLPRNESERYRKALDYIARSYGRFAAVLEEEYIFNWLAWDGDNMLATGAILDYGSIRQFAAKHNKYRFEDVDRFSSSLTEQRYWARQIVQAFAQSVGFIISGKKENLRKFKDAECLKAYDEAFDVERDYRMLWRIGFTPEGIKRLMGQAQPEIKNFRKALSYFEDLKISKGIEKLPDGVTHKPVFLIRNLLRELPAYYRAQCAAGERDEENCYMPPQTFCESMVASYVKRKDLQLTPARIAQAKSFQDSYRRLIRALGKPFAETIKILEERSAVINHEHRATGDGLIWITNEVLSVKEKIEFDELQDALDASIDSQVLIPGRWQPVPLEQLQSNNLKSRLLKKIQENLEEYKESI